jgi:hypothetical protein
MLPTILRSRGNVFSEPFIATIGGVHIEKHILTAGIYAVRH